MTSGVLANLRMLVRLAADRQMRPRTANRRRAARLAVAIGLAAFLAASIGLSASLESTMPQWRDPEFGHRIALLEARRSERSHRPLVIAIGTSRTQNCISPAAMAFPDVPGSPRVFNFGQSASPPVKELLTLHRLRDAGVRPHAVLVELLPASLMASGPAEGQLAIQAPRLSFSDIDHLAPYCDDAEGLRAAWLKARLNPWHTQRQVLMNHWFPKWQPWPERFEFQWTSLDADGFQPIGEVGAEARAKAVRHARQEYAGAFERFAVGKSSLRAIRDLVAICHEEGIRVAFFIPPVSPSFRASFRPGIYSEGEAVVQALGRRLRAPVFPAPRDMADDEFLDGHHMLRPGAERYSRWLGENYIRPWIEQPATGGVP